MRIQTLLLSLCVLILLGAAATWLAGSSLITVRRQHVGPAPWPQAQAVSLAAGPQMRVEGWYLAGSGRGARARRRRQGERRSTRGGRTRQDGGWRGGSIARSYS